MPTSTSNIQEWDERVFKEGNLLQIVRERIEECMSNPERHRNDPDHILAGFWGYHYQAGHQCYWNDRFCIAVMCNLPFALKQEAAWAMLCNGQSEYFEWHTHAGYRMIDVFRYLNIEVDNAHIAPITRMYSRLHRSISDEIARVFDLPTLAYGDKLTLTEAEAFRKNTLTKLHGHLELT